jgi:hypothetical protein
MPAGLELSADNGFLGIEDGFAGPKLEAERCHTGDVTRSASCVKRKLQPRLAVRVAVSSQAAGYE